MNRLTKQNHKFDLLNIMQGLTRYAEIDEIMNRLAAYEDTNLTPSDIADLRNELCIKCGRFKLAHEGACDGCRFRKE